MLDMELCLKCNGMFAAKLGLLAEGEEAGNTLSDGEGTLKPSLPADVTVLLLMRNLSDELLGPTFGLLAEA